MDIFIKATAGILIAVVLSLILSRQGKDYSVLLIIAVCAMVGGAVLQYLERILDFVSVLTAEGQLNSDFLSVIFKAVGISLLCEITTMICADSGNQAMGKMIRLLSTSVILWLSIPMFTELLELVKKITGSL